MSTGFVSEKKSVTGFMSGKQSVSGEASPTQIIADEYAVRFLPQSLTPEQQAQARENIDACNSNIIIIKPYGGDTLTWNGDVSGHVTASTPYSIHISDVVPDFTDFANGVTVELFSGDIITIDADRIHEMNSVYASQIPSTAWRVPPFVVALEDNAMFGVVTYPKKGIYFAHHDDAAKQVRSLTIPGYTGFPTEKLDPELLPTPTEFGAVSYNEQTLTPEQRAQVRDNIGAAAADDPIKFGEEFIGKLVYVDPDGNVVPLTLGAGLIIVDGVLTITGTVANAGVLRSSDGYILRDSNSRYIKPKEDV